MNLLTALADSYMSYADLPHTLLYSETGVLYTVGRQDMLVLFFFEFPPIKLRLNVQASTGDHLSKLSLSVEDPDSYSYFKSELHRQLNLCEKLKKSRSQKYTSQTQQRKRLTS